MDKNWDKYEPILFIAVFYGCAVLSILSSYFIILAVLAEFLIFQNMLINNPNAKVLSVRLVIYYLVMLLIVGLFFVYQSKLPSFRHLVHFLDKSLNIRFYPFNYLIVYFLTQIIVTFRRQELELIQSV